jgi:hypothetical protein
MEYAEPPLEREVMLQIGVYMSRFTSRSRATLLEVLDNLLELYIEFSGQITICSVAAVEAQHWKLSIEFRDRGGVEGIRDMWAVRANTQRTRARIRWGACVL